MEDILIVGVGSILMGDDGIGMRVIEELKKEDFPENVTLHGADISGLDLLKYFPQSGKVVIIDAADMGEEPGTIKIFGFDEIEQADFNDQFSTHGMALLETLTLADRLGVGCEIVIVGVQPEHVGHSLELTDLIQSKIPSVVETVKKLV